MGTVAGLRGMLSLRFAPKLAPKRSSSGRISTHIRTADRPDKLLASDGLGIDQSEAARGPYCWHGLIDHRVACNVPAASYDSASERDSAIDWTAAA